MPVSVASVSKASNVKCISEYRRIGCGLYDTQNHFIQKQKSKAVMQGSLSQLPFQAYFPQALAEAIGVREEWNHQSFVLLQKENKRMSITLHFLFKSIKTTKHDRNDNLLKPENTKHVSLELQM